MRSLLQRLLRLESRSRVDEWKFVIHPPEPFGSWEDQHRRHQARREKAQREGVLWASMTIPPPHNARVDPSDTSD